VLTSYILVFGFMCVDCFVFAAEPASQRVFSGDHDSGVSLPLLQAQPDCCERCVFIPPHGACMYLCIDLIFSSSTHPVKSL